MGKQFKIFNMLRHLSYIVGLQIQEKCTGKEGVTYKVCVQGLPGVGTVWSGLESYFQQFWKPENNRLLSLVID